MRRRAPRLQPGGVGDHDLGAVIHPGFGRFPEGQLVALDLEDGGVFIFRNVLTERNRAGTMAVYFVRVCACAASHHDVASPGHVAGVAQGADFGIGLVFKVQLLILDAHLASAWGQETGRRREEVSAAGWMSNTYNRKTVTHTHTLQVCALHTQRNVKKNHHK